MGSPGFDVDDLVGDLDHDLAARLDSALDNDQQQEQANAAQQDATQLGSLDQTTVTPTTTVGGAGGDGGFASGGDSVAAAGPGSIRL